MWPFIKEILCDVASATDAYLRTELPQETWDVFIQTSTKWFKIALEYAHFIMDFIAKVK